MAQSGSAVRNIVVTGGGTGIGRAVSLRFAEDGHRVTIVGRRREVLHATVDEIRAERGLDITPVVCDLADPDDVEAALSQLPDRVDVLVNNAGSRELAVGAGPHGMLVRWRGDFERNVLTAVLITESLRDRFTDIGRVVTVTSVAALRGGGSY